MPLKLKYLALVLLILVSSPFFSQVRINGHNNNNSQNTYKLAMQYFEQQEYDKANIYFDELFEKSPEAIYGYYYKSLLGAKDYDRAEKVTKKMLKQNRQNVYLYVYLGKVYKLQKNEKNETEVYEKAIKELVPAQPAVQSLANAFMEEGLLDYALQTFNKARTKDYPYYYERAEVFKQKGDIRQMINEYLDALEARETEIALVQSHLQNSLGYDDEEGGMNNPALKQELQKRIQKDPDKVVLSELLVFILKQQKEFDAAFVQLRALDKRMKEEGSRVYDLARICVSNQKWETAQRCYEYIIEKGPANLYYDAAMVEVLNVEYLALTQKPAPSREALLQLEAKLSQARQKYANTSLSGPIIKNLSTLQAYYLDKTNSAVELLSELVEHPGLDPLQKAEYKIMLADIHLVDGAIWDASLFYSQVEKDFKYEAIGQEAKFKNAKLSFYAGDFKWAKVQADVLKGATSKLISNDALDLSLIISDAIGVDTNEVPLQMFASAELMILQHKYNQSIARMDSINSLFSTHTLGDDIYFKKARIYTELAKLNEAESMYKNIIDFFPDELYGDDAQFKLAELYEKHLMDREKARVAYQEVLTKYPGSIFVVEARKRFRELRGDNLTN